MKTKSSSKTNIGTDSDPIYISKQNDDLDFVETNESKLPHTSKHQENHWKKMGKNKLRNLENQNQR